MLFVVFSSDKNNNFLSCSFWQINQKGSEKPLELAFDKMVTSLGNGMIK